MRILNIAEKNYRFRFFCNVATCIIITCIIKESSLLFKLCLNFYLHFYLHFSFKILVVKLFLWNKKNIFISLFHIVMLFISKTYNWCFINYFNYSMTLPTSLWNCQGKDNCWYKLRISDFCLSFFAQTILSRKQKLSKFQNQFFFKIKIVILIS